MGQGSKWVRIIKKIVENLVKHSLYLSNDTICVQQLKIIYINICCNNIFFSFQDVFEYSKILINVSSHFFSFFLSQLAWKKEWNCVCMYEYSVTHRVSIQIERPRALNFINPDHEHPWSTYTVADEIYSRVSFQGERVFYTFILEYHTKLCVDILF